MIIEENEQRYAHNITMAATMEETKSELILYLSKRSDYVHVILEADRLTLLSRICNDKGNHRDTSLVIDYMEPNVRFERVSSFV